MVMGYILLYVNKIYMYVAIMGKNRNAFPILLKRVKYVAISCNFVFLRLNTRNINVVSLIC